MKRSLQCAWLLAVVACFTGVVRGDGFIVIHDGPVVPHHFPFAPLEVAYHRVNVEIDHPVAVTRVDQEFYNPNGRQLEGTYLFPLPAGATIDKFSMNIGDKQVEAELLPADKARQIYEDIVRKYKDPALLEYVGRGAFRARIFPIEPHSRKRIKLQFTQMLKPDSGITEYTYALNTKKYSARPLKEVSIKVDLKCESQLKSIYSPTHDVDVKRSGDGHAVIGFEAKDVRPDSDFKLIYTQNALQNVGVSVLTYRRAGEDGYFLVMASPGMAKGVKPQPKDICFVIDTSGSMAESGGKKLQQAKKALSFCLANLNREDRFEVVRFSTEAEGLFETLVDASTENVKKAQDFVEAFKPVGGTAIGDALEKAMEANRSDSKRPYQVIFLTDGQPTIGETNEDKLVKQVEKHADNDVHLFPFGIGTDVNTHLLDRVANETRAFSQYVLPEEDLELKLSSFYGKIQSPTMTDVKLKLVIAGRRVENSRVDPISDVRIKQVYPDEMPDLFMGQTLLAFGRYTGTGDARVHVTGMRNGEKEDYSVAGNFPDKDDTHDYIARLWATRRIGWLLDEIRLRNESKELKDEVVGLAREHGVVTPYTAYLIMEDEGKRNVPVAARTFRDLETDPTARGAAKDHYETARNGSDRLQKAGAQAVANAQNTQRLKQNSCIDNIQVSAGLARAPAQAGPATEAAGYRMQQNYVQQVRVVSGKCFYQNGATWSDTTAQANQNLKRQEVKFNSEDYFALVRRAPQVAQWLSLGNEVDVVIEDTLYVIRG